MYDDDVMLGLRLLCELQLCLHLSPLLTTVSCFPATMRNGNLLHVIGVFESISSVSSLQVGLLLLLSLYKLYLKFVWQDVCYFKSISIYVILYLCNVMVKPSLLSGQFQCHVKSHA
jgi:hypothetical protein